jgi:hypothetical protein
VEIKEDDINPQADLILYHLLMVSKESCSLVITLRVMFHKGD